MNFREKLEESSRRNRSLLCIGLDPDPALMPIADVLEFNRAIIEATSDLACAYKPNLAFYEALGAEGWPTLKGTLEAIPAHIPSIGDAKRGDVGHTARAYARALFEVLGCDAVTVNPYLGGDAVQPFLDYRERGVFILCRTSNPGAGDFQDALVEGRPLYERVAERARAWNTAGNVGLVVGATYPQELERIRALCPELLILAPGVGPQQGDLEATVRRGQDRRGGGLIIAASRQIIYASKGRDYAAAARREAQALRDAINTYRVLP